MYTEFHAGVKRDGWVFAYKGSELLGFATARLAYHKERQEFHRKRAAEMLLSSGVSSQSKKLQQHQSLARTHGERQERCEIYAHEFARKPDHEYLLSLGDVVFFGLAGHKPSDEPEGEDD